MYSGIEIFSCTINCFCENHLEIWDPLSDEMSVSESVNSKIKIVLGKLVFYWDIYGAYFLFYTELP